MKEDQNTEWKEAWRDEYLKWICGFANAQGGRLMVGVDDRGKVVGLHNAQKLLEDIPNKVRDVLGVMVDVNLKSEKGLDYLEIVVDAHPNPVNCRGEYHYRSGSTKQELKGAALDAFLMKKNGLRWDGVPVPRLAAADCSGQAFKLFRAKAAQGGRISKAGLGGSDLSLLGNLRLLEDGYLKRAAVLLFHDDPEKFVGGAFVKIGFFANDAELLYQDEVHGNLFHQADAVLDLLATKYLKAYISYEGVQRVERMLFPADALREALFNALAHKDYGSGVPVQISVYDNRIVFWNAGQLPQELDLARLKDKHPSIPFNPLIANAFFRAGLIESWGRGIEAINLACRAHGIPPPQYSQDFGGLMLTFRADPQRLVERRKKPDGGDKDASGRDLGGASGKTSGKTSRKASGIASGAAPEGTSDEASEKASGKTEKTSGKTSGEMKKTSGMTSGEISGITSGKTSGEAAEKTSGKIIALMTLQPQITIPQIASLLEISHRAVEMQISALKRKGLLERVGPAKGGRWQVTGAPPRP